MDKSNVWKITFGYNDGDRLGTHEQEMVIPADCKTENDVRLYVQLNQRDYTYWFISAERMTPLGVDEIAAALKAEGVSETSVVYKTLLWLAAREEKHDREIFLLKRRLNGGK
jgi:hypothetical protein